MLMLVLNGPFKRLCVIKRQPLKTITRKLFRTGIMKNKHMYTNNFRQFHIINDGFFSYPTATTEGLGQKLM